MVFPAFSQVGRPKTQSFSRFSAKGGRNPKPAKSRQGESSLGPLFCDTGSPKTTFSGTSSNCRAVLGRGGGGYVGRGGTAWGGGVREATRKPPLFRLVCVKQRILSVLVGLRYPQESRPILKLDPASAHQTYDLSVPCDMRYCKMAKHLLALLVR